MSRAEEFRRLMLHAAELLERDRADVVYAFEACRKASNIESTRARIVGEELSYATGVTYAVLVLEMVASFLVDEPELEAQP